MENTVKNRPIFRFHRILRPVYKTGRKPDTAVNRACSTLSNRIGHQVHEFQNVTNFFPTSLRVLWITGQDWSGEAQIGNHSFSFLDIETDAVFNGLFEFNMEISIAIDWSIRMVKIRSKKKFDSKFCATERHLVFWLLPLYFRSKWKPSRDKSDQ